jgi:hypothetical protein
MADKNRTTLSGITPEQLLRLKFLALQMTGEISVSALIRHIADYGRIEKYQSGEGIKDRLVVEIPKKEGG